MTKAVVQILNRLSEPILTLIFFEDGYPEGIGADLLSTIERNRGDNAICKVAKEIAYDLSRIEGDSRWSFCSTEDFNCLMVSYKYTIREQFLEKAPDKPVVNMWIFDDSKNELHEFKPYLVKRIKG